MDGKLPGSSLHGISQARILEWVAISCSRGSSWPRDPTWVSCVSCIGRAFLYLPVHHLGSPYHELGGLNNRAFFLRTLEAGKSWNQGASMVRFWGGLASWLSDSHFLTCHPVMDRAWAYLSSSFVVQPLSHLQLFVTLCTATWSAPLPFTISWSLSKFMSVESVMPSNHLILCHPLLLLPSVFPSIRVFFSESALHIRWPKYWSFSFSISLSNEYSGLISFRMDWCDLLTVQGTLKPHPESITLIT